MRIGLITGEYPPDRGGVGDFTHHLGRSLSTLDHEVHVLTSVPQSHTEAQEPSRPTGTARGVSVHRVLEDWGFGCWRRILAWSRSLELDVLDIQYQAAAYAMHPAINFVPRRRRRPILAVTFHDLKVPYLFPKAGPLRRWMVYLLARRADGVIVTNREDQLTLSDLKPLPANLARIPIGSNIPLHLPRDYDRAVERANRGVGRDDILLGYFGFLNQSKGGETLIEMLHLLVEEGMPAHLLKIGGRAGSSDPTNRAYADRIDALIATYGLQERVHWTGYVRAEEVSASLMAVDLCVLPYRDGVSFRRGSLLACLTHERAIITTRPAVALPEVKNGENMLMVEPENSTALARAVRQVVSDPTAQAQLEAGARSLASHFTWDQIATRTVQFFDALLGS